MERHCATAYRPNREILPGTVAGLASSLQGFRYDYVRCLHHALLSDFIEELTVPPISDRLLSCTKWFVLLTALALGACASQPQAPANAATADYSYKIGPGDTLNIVVWRNPELSMSVPVRPDGKISAPLIDDVWLAQQPSHRFFPTSKK